MIFIFVMLMGEFASAVVVYGGKISTTGTVILNYYGIANYPFAAVNALMLMLAMMFGVMSLFCGLLISARSYEMARWTPKRLRKLWIKTGFSIYFIIFLLFLYGPMIAMFILSFQGRRGGTNFPMKGFSLYWWNKLIEPSTVGDLQGAMGRSLDSGIRLSW